MTPRLYPAFLQSGLVQLTLYVAVINLCQARLIEYQSPGIGTCGAAIKLSRTGDLLGAYSVDGFNNSLFGIDGRSYRIDSTGAVFNLTYLSPPATAVPVVEGNFQCTCNDQSSKVSFAATGSFRLKAKWSCVNAHSKPDLTEIIHFSIPSNNQHEKVNHHLDYWCQFTSLGLQILGGLKRRSFLYQIGYKNRA